MKSEVVQLSYEVELSPGETLALPEPLKGQVGAGRWLITIQPMPKPASIRDHAAFLNSYAPEDEGLYDDYPSR
jgi:hypothetical protein